MSTACALPERPAPAADRAPALPAPAAGAPQPGTPRLQHLFRRFPPGPLHPLMALLYAYRQCDPPPEDSHD
jgi:hypothetical protein